MSDQRASVQPLSDWLQVSRTIEIALEGLTEDDLNCEAGPTAGRSEKPGTIWSSPTWCMHHRDRCGGHGRLHVRLLVAEPGPGVDGADGIPWGGGPGHRGVVSIVPICKCAPPCCPRWSATRDQTLGAPGTEPCPMTVEQMICQEVETRAAPLAGDR